MQAFTVLTATVAPLDRANVDTDQIIPKQFLKSILRTGFGQNLFDDWRYLDQGLSGQDCSKRPINPDFILNKPCYQGANILLARRNFGCGSSREHAPWALLEYGFKCIIAPGFAEIFYNNCFKNGILPITLSEEKVASFFDKALNYPGFSLTINLQTQEISEVNGGVISFEIEPFRRQCLLNGLDDIGLSLNFKEQILTYQENRQIEKPWLFK